MDEIARLPVPGGRSAARAAWGWVTRPRHIALSPLGGLAIATGVAALALVLSGRRPGSAPPAEDTPREFEFVVVAPRAASVSLVGDFNDWDAARTPMRPSQRGGPLWTAVVPLAPGRYRYAFLVDGSRWLADPAGAVHEEGVARSEEHTSELQSRFDLVCRLLLEKKKKHNPKTNE